MWARPGLPSPNRTRTTVDAANGPRRRSHGLAHRSAQREGGFRLPQCTVNASARFRENPKQIVNRAPRPERAAGKAPPDSRQSPETALRLHDAAAE
jgi:hypothetical protein